MAEVLDPIEQTPLVLHTRPALDMDDEQFFRFCQLNRDLRIERTAQGDLIIMPPTGGSSGHGNAKLTHLFFAWSERDGTGQVFDSSAGFRLPNGATRSPDVSWVRNQRLNELGSEEWAKFLPLCPDFVLELRSPKDPLRIIKQKMEEYVRNGARLGWILDPVKKHVHVYRPGKPVEVLENPLELSGEPVLLGFVLDVPDIWAVMIRRPSR